VITAYFDGGSRGNPGSAGYGAYVVNDRGEVLAELAEGIGMATNNVAEYRGLLAALQWAADHGVTELHVKGDSLLLVQQMLGNYRVKNAGLLPLYREARHLCARIGRVSFEHIPREMNKNADRLSNIGMDQNTGSPT
jgi:ribonuclease HI